MKALRSTLLVLVAIFTISAMTYADDGNVWLVDKDGNKHFTCPVMGNDGIVSMTTKFSDHDGKRYYYCCPGCKGSFEKDPQKFLSKLTLPANVTSVSGAEKTFSCPVTGETGVVTAETDYSDYEGKRYYFCCAGCKPKFEKEPKKFAAAVMLEAQMMEDCSNCDKCKEHGEEKKSD